MFFIVAIAVKTVDVFVVVAVADIFIGAIVIVFESCLAIVRYRIP